MKPFKFAMLLLFLTFMPAVFADTAVSSGATYDLGFSPGETSLSVVLKAINSSRTSLYMACYEFTSRDIAAAIEAAAHRGVKVRIVADFKASRQKYSQISILKAASIPIRLDKHYSIMHDKFIIIDRFSIETGSFNYSMAAIKHNAENALVLWHVPALAAKYTTEFDRLWAESLSPRS